MLATEGTGWLYALQWRLLLTTSRFSIFPTFLQFPLLLEPQEMRTVAMNKTNEWSIPINKLSWCSTVLRMLRMFLDTRYWQGSADKKEEEKDREKKEEKTTKVKSQQNNKELSFSRALFCPAMKPRVPVRLSSQPRLTRAGLQQPSWMFDTHLHSSALSDNRVPFSCLFTQKLGIGRSRRERERQTDRQTDWLTDRQTNSKTLLCKDCSLGSIKNLPNN